MPSDSLSAHTLTVLAYGLDLKDRLAGGDQPAMATEQGELRRLLLAEEPVRSHPDYAESLPRPVPADCPAFLGVRYALACWADEIFLADPTCQWRQAWQSVSLERQMYGTSCRLERFWQQAELALARSGPEAAEGYLWCVTLGFRGEPPTGVNPGAWVEQARRRVLASRQVDPKLPADKGLRTYAPPLRGPRAVQSAGRLLAASGVAGVLAAAAVGGRWL